MKPVVLLVYRSSQQLQSLSQALEAGGLDVYSFMDGQGALTSFLDIKPDIVVLDAVSPGLNGAQFCKEVRFLAGEREVPIIATNDLHYRVELRKALESYGAREVLERGFTEADLVASVWRLLAGVGQWPGATEKSVEPAGGAGILNAGGLGNPAPLAWTEIDAAVSEAVMTLPAPSRPYSTQLPGSGRTVETIPGSASPSRDEHSPLTTAQRSGSSNEEYSSGSDVGPFIGPRTRPPGGVEKGRYDGRGAKTTASEDVTVPAASQTSNLRMKEVRVTLGGLVARVSVLLRSMLGNVRLPATVARGTNLGARRSAQAAALLFLIAVAWWVGRTTAPVLSPGVTPEVPTVKKAVEEGNSIPDGARSRANEGRVEPGSQPGLPLRPTRLGSTEDPASDGRSDVAHVRSNAWNRTGQPGAGEVVSAPKARDVEDEMRRGSNPSAITSQRKTQLPPAAAGRATRSERTPNRTTTSILGPPVTPPTAPAAGTDSLDTPRIGTEPRAGPSDQEETTREADSTPDGPVPIDQLDTRPSPVSRPSPSYPPAARQLRIQGEVLVQALVLETGEVGEVRIVRSPSPLLADAAQNAVKAWRYRPATKGGKPVQSWTIESIAFRY